MPKATLIIFAAAYVLLGCSPEPKQIPQTLWSLSPGGIVTNDASGRTVYIGTNEQNGELVFITMSKPVYLGDFQLKCDPAKPLWTWSKDVTFSTNADGGLVVTSMQTDSALYIWGNKTTSMRFEHVEFRQGITIP